MTERARSCAGSLPSQVGCRPGAKGPSSFVKTGKKPTSTSPQFFDVLIQTQGQVSQIKTSLEMKCGSGTPGL